MADGRHFEINQIIIPVSRQRHGQLFCHNELYCGRPFYTIKLQKSLKNKTGFSFSLFVVNATTLKHQISQFIRKFLAQKPAFTFMITC